MTACLKAKLDRLLAASKRDTHLVQTSGGEPTVNPHWVEMVEMSLAQGVSKIHVNANGIELA